MFYIKHVGKYIGRSMTSLLINSGWTPQLIEKDKELKEKYGIDAHISPEKSYGVSLQNQVETDKFEHANKSDAKDTGKKKWWIAAGAILAVGAAIAGVVLTRGKKTSSLLGGTADDVAKRIDAVLTKAKEANKVYYSQEPVVTKLKNGGYKYEFAHLNNSPNGNPITNSYALIFDKTGKFDKSIYFTKNSANNKVINYNVYNQPEAADNALIKSMKRKTLEKRPSQTEAYSLRVKTYSANGSAMKNIDVTSNDKVRSISIEGMNADKSPVNKSTFIYYNANGKPEITTIDDFQNNVGFVKKPGQPKIQVDNTTNVLTEEQKGDGLELLIGKRSFNGI